MRKLSRERPLEICMGLAWVCCYLWDTEVGWRSTRLGKVLIGSFYLNHSKNIWFWELDCKEGRTPKNWCLWTMVLEKTPARRSNQSILREIYPEYSLEWLMLKLKLQYIGHLMWIDDSLEKSLILGKIEGRRRRGHQRTRWLRASLMQWTWIWANSGRQWGIGSPDVPQSMRLQRIRHN